MNAYFVGTSMDLTNMLSDVESHGLARAQQEQRYPQIVCITTMPECSLLGALPDSLHEPSLDGRMADGAL